MDITEKELREAIGSDTITKRLLAKIKEQRKPKRYGASAYKTFVTEAGYEARFQKWAKARERKDGDNNK